MTTRRLFVLHCLLLCLQLVQTKNLRSQFTLPLDGVPSVDVKDGVTFTRSIKHLNATFTLHLEDHHCRTQDMYGDNDCHYDWGEKVLGSYTVVSPHVIQQGDYMTGTFHVRLS